MSVGKKGILAALDGDKRLDVAELTAATGLSRKTVFEHMKGFKDESPRRVYVVGWRRADRPVYAAGDGVDVPAPKPLTITQRNRKYWKRVKRDPVRHLNKIMRMRAYVARTRPRRVDCDPLVALFFGR